MIVSKEYYGKKVWILEQHAVDVKNIAPNKEGEYIFEATCADFNGYNDNTRYYDKDDYVNNHLPYLKEKIESGSLVGELDHNENFLVELKHGACKVLDIWYDEAQNIVKLKVQLLKGVDQGDNAIGYVNNDVTLYISSRAAGIIDNKGRVYLEKIYTYDIVSEPGFKNADLIRVYEHKSTDDTSSDGISIFIYECKDQGDITEINKQNQISDDMADKALEKRVLALEAVVKGSKQMIFESLHTPKTISYNGFKIESLNQVPEVGKTLLADDKEFIIDSVHELKSIKDESNELFKLKGIFKYAINLKEGDSETTRRAYIAGNGDILFDNMEEDEEVVTTPKEEETVINKTIIDKVNELVEANRINSHQQKIVIKYLNGLKPVVESIIIQSDQVISTVNNMIDGKSVGDKTFKEIIKYSDGLSDEVNKLTKIVEELEEDTIPEEVTDEIEKIKESLNTQSRKILRMGRTQKNTLGLIKKTTKSMEEEEELDEEENVETVIESVKTVLEEVKTKKATEQNLKMQGKYPFLSKLKKEVQAQFVNLDSFAQKIVSDKIQDGASSSTVNKLITESLQNVDGMQLLMSQMPQKMVANWNGADTAKKQRILTLFRSKNIRTQEGMVQFWKSVELKKVKGLKRLQSDSPVLEPEIASNLAYSTADVDGALGL